MDEEPGWSRAGQDAAEAADPELTPPVRERRRSPSFPEVFLFVFVGVCLVLLVLYIVALFTLSTSDFVP